MYLTHGQSQWIWFLEPVKAAYVTYVMRYCCTGRSAIQDTLHKQYSKKVEGFQNCTSNIASTILEPLKWVLVQYTTYSTPTCIVTCYYGLWTSHSKFHWTLGTCTSSWASLLKHALIYYSWLPWQLTDIKYLHVSLHTAPGVAWYCTLFYLWEVATNHKISPFIVHRNALYIVSNPITILLTVMMQ